MDLRGEFRIPGRREAVWAALRDESVLSELLPGLKSIEAAGTQERTAKVALKVGTLRPTITATVAPVEWNPPEALTLSVAGKSPSAGSITGTVRLTLHESDGATTVSLHGTGELTGKLADAEPAAVREAARKLAADYFAGLAERETTVEDLEHSPAAVETHTESAAPVEDKIEGAAEFAEETEKQVEVAAARGFLGGPMVWGLLALAGLVIILAFLR
jgi:carbon monoxide dehydrogenase subunit G